MKYGEIKESIHSFSDLSKTILLALHDRYLEKREKLNPKYHRKQTIDRRHLTRIIANEAKTDILERYHGYMGPYVCLDYLKRKLSDVPGASSWLLTKSRDLIHHCEIKSREETYNIKQIVNKFKQIGSSTKKQVQDGRIYWSGRRFVFPPAPLECAKTDSVFCDSPRQAYEHIKRYRRGNCGVQAKAALHLLRENKIEGFNVVDVPHINHVVCFRDSEEVVDTWLGVYYTSKSEYNKKLRETIKIGLKHNLKPFSDDAEFIVHSIQNIKNIGFYPN